MRIIKITAQVTETYKVTEEKYRELVEDYGEDGVAHGLSTEDLTDSDSDGWSIVCVTDENGKVIG